MLGSSLQSVAMRSFESLVHVTYSVIHRNNICPRDEPQVCMIVQAPHACVGYDQRSEGITREPDFCSIGMNRWEVKLSIWHGLALGTAGRTSLWTSRERGMERVVFCAV